MPNLANKAFFESVVSRETTVKQWLGQVSDVLKIDYLTTKYYYLDKRAADLARSHLQHARAKTQKVHLQINSIKCGGSHEFNKERD